MTHRTDPLAADRSRPRAHVRPTIAKTGRSALFRDPQWCCAAIRGPASRRVGEDAFDMDVNAGTAVRTRTPGRR